MFFNGIKLRLNVISEMQMHVTLSEDIFRNNAGTLPQKFIKYKLLKLF